MPETTENENALSRRLNKVLETRFENDQVIIIITIIRKILIKIIGYIGSLKAVINVLQRKYIICQT